METKNRTNTYKEIVQQPQMWQKEFDLIHDKREEIHSFLLKNSVSKVSEILLTGAGTSAFIGDAIEYILPRKGYANTKAVATTDLITHPYSFINAHKEIVMVSFARSGNSPESLAAIEVANSIAKKVVHIFITCNESGQLAQEANDDNTLLVLLPPETNDVSLAMTSSFSTMFLAFLLVMNVGSIEAEKQKIGYLSAIARETLEKYEFDLKSIASKQFSRAIFLGSGELKGIAEECHLKLQELTDGQVICKFDSFLGFRHGPKAVISSDSLLIYLLSEDPYVYQYEKDLIEQINSNNRVVAQVIINAGDKIVIPNINFDLQINMQGLFEKAGEYSCIPYVFVGQLLGFYKSLDLGLNPDSPSVSGNISRVVEGVNIYPLEQ